MGFLLAFAYFGFLILAAILIPVTVSWRLLRSVRLALVTLVSGAALQLCLASVASLNMENQIRSLAMQQEAQSQERRSRIQVVAVQAETADSLNTRFEYYGPAYRHLRLDLTVDSRRAGSYRMRVHYSPLHNSGYDIRQEQEIHLSKGRNVVVAEMGANQFPLGGYWFRDDQSKVEVLIYQTSQLPKPLLGPRPTPGMITFVEQEFLIPGLSAYRPTNRPSTSR